jgi:phosphate transport system substrate-binding protein
MKQTLAIAALATLAFAASAEARDQIRVVGSSTVYPFTTAAAERFGQSGEFPTPVIESTGTGGGFKLFCAGVGVDHPDLSNASRAIKQSEVEMCAKNGVDEITEIKVGYDGIVLANSKQAEQVEFTVEQIWQGLAKEVPVDGEIVPNPYRNWSDIDPSLPDTKIEVLGPPPTSGTRDAFVELVMEVGCESFPEVEALDEDRMEQVCKTMREDGGFVEAGENDNLIVQKLDANKAAFGIFGFSFLDQNADKLQGSLVSGVEPTYENIADGSYPVSRPLFIYVKNAHAGVIPGIQEFIDEYTSERAMGEDGYLADKGLIALPEEEYEQVREKATSLTPMATASN